MQPFVSALVLFVLVALAIPAPAQTRSNALPAANLARTVPALDTKHKLRPGDRVSLQILEDRDEARKLQVTDSGELDVPYIGRVSVANKTSKEAAAEIEALLEKDFYYQATVSLGLDAINRVQSRVYIVGQVNKQGSIDIPDEEKFTAGKAILLAGGFSDFADKKKVKVVRTNASDKKTEFELNMVDILEKGKTEKDIVLEPDDLIVVPQRLVNF